MKIRSQFVILLSGIIVVPFVLGLAVTIIWKMHDQQSVLIPDVTTVFEQTGKKLDEQSWEALKNNLSKKPIQLETVVLDQRGLVLYSSADRYSPGLRINTTSGILDSFFPENDGVVYQTEIIHTTTEQFIVVTRFDRNEFRPPRPFDMFLVGTLIILIMIFIFSAIVSVLIARSISTSVSSLEHMTRRIADGELDLEIDLSGSNEITSLASSLNHLRLSLKEEEVRRSRFIMGISHDLKTPLSLIKGYAEAVLDGVAQQPDEMDKSLTIITTKVDQLESMIDDLIGYARMDSSEWRQTLHPGSLGIFLQEFCLRMRNDATVLSRKFSWTINIEDDLMIQYDEHLLTRALENICMNAFRYTRDNDSVSFSACKVPDPAETQIDQSWSTILIEICDTGSGIAEQDIPYIFDPFWRASASRREAGMGMGLTIVRNIIDSHGWDIRVRSEEGSGTCFEIMIPIV